MEDLKRQTLYRQEGRREGFSPARAPPLHCPALHLPTLRAQPELRFPSGEREKVPARPPPLKGAAPPLPLHHSYPDSALSLRHLSGTLKAWISPPSGLLLPGSVALSARRIGRAGPEVGFAWRFAAAATEEAVLGKATTTVRTGQTRHRLFVELSSVPGCLECGPPPRCESLRGDCGSRDFLHTQSPRC